MTPNTLPTTAATESRLHVGTSDAARYLGRRPKVLYSWLGAADVPVVPVRVRGRWLWPMVEIRRALGIPEPEVGHG